MSFIKNILFLIGLSLIINICFAQSITTGWELVGGALSESTTSQSMPDRMVFDNEGNLYVAYNDYAYNKGLFVKKRDGTNRTELNRPSSNTTIYYPSLEIVNNELYITFRDASLKAIFVKKYNKINDTWISLNMPDFHDPGRTMIESDSNGNIYVSYFNFSDKKAYIWKYDGNQWTQIGSNVCQAGVWYSFLQTNSQDEVFMGCREGYGSSNGPFSVWKWNGSGTTTRNQLGTDIQTKYNGIKTQRAGFYIDKEDSIYVGYSDPDTANGAFSIVTRNTGTSSWDKVGYALAGYPEIMTFVGENFNDLYIIGHDMDINESYVLHHTESGRNKIADPLSTNQPFYYAQDIELYNGTPYISYGDDSDHKLFVKKFVGFEPPKEFTAYFQDFPNYKRESIALEEKNIPNVNWENIKLSVGDTYNLAISASNHGSKAIINGKVDFFGKRNIGTLNPNESKQLNINVKIFGESPGKYIIE